MCVLAWPMIPCDIGVLQWLKYNQYRSDNWAPSSEFVSSSIPSWQILTAHAQTFRGARDLAFCLKIPLDSLLVWASSEGSGETARMRRLAWTFAARIGDKYQIRLTRSNYFFVFPFFHFLLSSLKGIFLRLKTIHPAAVEPFLKKLFLIQSHCI